ncbi:MAG: hypothetical protein AVDCRST_MAG32-36, partial [uncultured Nocardioides sp.]
DHHTAGTRRQPRGRPQRGPLDPAEPHPHRRPARARALRRL